MLKRIAVKHFRSCDDVVIDNIGSMLALVGRNSAGKTNILKAILGIAQSATSSEVFLNWSSDVDCEIEIELDDTTYKYTISFGGMDSGSLSFKESLSVKSDSSHWQLVANRENELVSIGNSESMTIGSLTFFLPAILSLKPSNDPVVKLIKPVVNFLETIRYYPLDEPSDAAETLGFIQAESYQSWKVALDQSDKVDDSIAMRLLHLHLQSPERFDEIRSLLGEEGLSLLAGIYIHRYAQATEGENNSNYYRVRFIPIGNFGSPLHALSYSQLSLGTRRVLRLITSLIFDKSSVLLIEHPEDGIHRGLLRKLMGLLKTYADPAQVIIASHSSTVFNSILPEEVRLVTMEEGTTKVRPLDEQEMTAARKFLEEEGTMAELLDTLEEE